MFDKLAKRYPRFYRRLTFTNIVWGCLVFSLLWNEYLSYYLVSWHWSTLKSRFPSQPEEELRVMFVADPQMIGLHNELPYVGPISRWDCDRYLRATFRRAYTHIRPDVVVFLGDLLDEGSGASDADYDAYMARFRTVFVIPTRVKVVYIAGDNDVGGEGFDQRLQSKIDAFNRHFIPDETPPRGVVNAKFVDFLRLSLIGYYPVAEAIKRELTDISRQTSALWKVACNHETIINRYHNDQNDIISLTKSNIIFTAHEHKALLHTCTDCHTRTPSARHGRQFEGVTQHIVDHRVYHLDLSAPRYMYEVMVPTCSYRMGVPTMGYGSALINVRGELQYTVLWLPQRYKQLKYHVISLVVACVLLITAWCVRSCIPRRR